MIMIIIAGFADWGSLTSQSKIRRPRRRKKLSSHTDRKKAKRSTKAGLMTASGACGSASPRFARKVFWVDGSKVVAPHALLIFWLFRAGARLFP